MVLAPSSSLISRCVTLPNAGQVLLPFGDLALSTKTPQLVPDVDPGWQLARLDDLLLAWKRATTTAARRYWASQLALQLAAYGPWECGHLAVDVWRALADSLIPTALNEPAGETRFVEANKVFVELVGHSARTLAGTSYFDWLDPLSRRFAQRFSLPRIARGHSAMLHHRRLWHSAGRPVDTIVLQTQVFEHHVLRRYLFAAFVPVRYLSTALAHRIMGRRLRPVAIRPWIPGLPPDFPLNPFLMLTLVILGGCT
jgi:hypothetical protein